MNKQISKYVIGLNIFDNPNFLKLGIITQDGNKLYKNSFPITNLYYNDQIYTRKMQITKIKDLCNIIN